MCTGLNVNIEILKSDYDLLAITFNKQIDKVKTINKQTFNQKIMHMEITLLVIYLYSSFSTTFFFQESIKKVLRKYHKPILLSKQCFCH